MEKNSNDDDVDCHDKLDNCAILIKTSAMNCRNIGAQEYCNKSCNSCGTQARMKKSDAIGSGDSDCFDKLKNCDTLIETRAMNCRNIGAQEYCRRSCNSCGTQEKV